MRKRYLALAAATAVMMMVSGCSGKAQDPGSETTQTGTQQTEASGDSQSGETQPEEEGEQMGPLRVWGTITEVGEDRIVANCESDSANMGEVVLLIDPDNTYVLGAVDGLPVDLKDVEIGNFEAYLSPAMTMSLPPQNTPYAVIVNIPEDMQAPQYVVAAGPVDDTNGAGILTGIDETEYTLARSVNIQPFLTKNIVALKDIERESRCLVWMNDEGDVDRIVLFGE